MIRAGLFAILGTSMLAVVAPLEAQQPVERRMAVGAPAPADASDPRVQRAQGLVTLLLREDFEGARNFLQTNAVPASPAATDAVQQVEAIRAALGGGGYELGRIGNDPRGGVLAILVKGGAGRVALMIDVESAAPNRFRAVRVGRSQQSAAASEGAAGATDILAPTSGLPVVRRANELVSAVNSTDAAARKRFAEEAWNTEGGPADEVVRILEDIHQKFGNGLKLTEVRLMTNGEAEARVVNDRGRRSTVLIAVDPQPPHLMSLRGLVREPERELASHERAPASVELAGPVARAPLTFLGPRPVVDVMIDGQGPFRMLVETGCECIDISPAVAARLGTAIEALTDDDLYRVGDARIDSIYKLDEIRIGDARLKDVAVMVQNSLDVDGIIGLPAFKDVLLTVDYPNKELRLEKGDLPPPDGKEILPVRPIIGPFLGIDLDIGGKTVPSIIDTQSGLGLSISTELAQGLRFQKPPVKVGEVVMQGTITAPLLMGRLKDDFKIGRFTVQSQIAEIIAHPPDRPRLGNIGGQILKNFVVTLDQRNKRVRFTKPGNATLAASPPYRSFGFILRRQEDGLRIESLLAGGAAEKAGLKPGDVIARIDGKPVADLRVKGMTAGGSINRLAEAARPYKIEVVRDGKPLTVTLQGEVMVS